MRIGVIDSGIGGLTLLSRLTKEFRGNDFIYFGDTLNAPYGNKPREFIISRVREICTLLVKRKVDIIVLACNTASVTALDVLKSEFDIPILGVKPAFMGEKDIILCTPLTAKSSYIEMAREKGCFIIEEPTLASEIESVAPYFCALESRVSGILFPYRDSILHLACTHYVFLKTIIKEIFPNIEIHDGYDAVVASLKPYLNTPTNRGFSIEFLLENAKLGRKYSRIFDKLQKI